MWVQRTNKRETGIYKAIKCEDLYDPEMQSPQFMSQIVGAYCPDMQGNPIQFQQGIPGVKNSTEKDFFFVIDLCEHFANYTGRTDCKSKEESLKVINDIKIEAKVSHEFFNVNNYVLNGHNMNSEFITYHLALNKDVFQRNAYKVAKNNIKFRNSYIVNWSFYGGENLSCFNAEPV